MQTTKPSGVEEKSLTACLDKTGPTIKGPIQVDAPNYDGYYAITLENVLSDAECDRLIAFTEAAGYEEALVNVGGGNQIKALDYRNSGRVIIDDADFADALLQRIGKYIPSEFEGWSRVAINERMRFLRYNPGEFFKPHMDGAYVAPNGDRTIVTLQLYLNEGAEGGSTRFFAGDDDSNYKDCVPKKGMVLLFQHDMLHSGEKVIKGRKYAMRTDVLYRRPVKSGHFFTGPPTLKF